MSSHVQFDKVYHGLEPAIGRLRLTGQGMAWKSSSTEDPKTITVEAEKMKSFQFIKSARGYQMRISLKKGKRRETFDGFKRDDKDRLSAAISEYYSKALEGVEVSVRGWNWGEARIEDSDVKFVIHDKVAFEIPAALVANSNIAGKTEVSMEFTHPGDEGSGGGSSSTANGKSRRLHGDQLVEMRLYIPGEMKKASDAGSDRGSDDDEEERTKANHFHQLIKAEADIGQTAGDDLLVFKDVMVTTPRGRYDLDMYPTFLRLRGKTYDYKVLYSSITRLFLLPRPDDVHVQIVIGLDPPIRQGQTRYPYLVLQFVREHEMDAVLNMDDEELQTRFEGKLKKRYEEPTFKVVTTLFRVLSGQKLVAPSSDSFESASNSQPCLKCNIKATDGLLYPLDKQLIWVSKQPVHIPHSDIHQVVFCRLGGAVASSKTFDLRIVLKSGPEVLFSSLSREEHDRLNEHFASKKLRVKNEMNELEAAGAVAAALLDSDDDEDMDDDEDDDEGYKGKSKRKSAAKAGSKKADAMDEDEDSEDDEDFEASASESDGEPSESDDDDDGGAETGSDDMVDEPKKKKQKK